MRIVIAGGHGQVARITGRLLADRGDEVVGLVRDPDHVADLDADGVGATVLDLEHASVEQVAQVLRGADAVVFAAVAGPGSGDARKDTVDRAGAVLLADAAEQAGVERYLLVSAMGVDAVQHDATPEGVDPGMVVYLRAELAAGDDLLGRDLQVTVLRPGGLTDAEPTGRVTLAPSVDRGQVPRADVAAVLVALLDDPGADGAVLELVSGGMPVVDAVAVAVPDVGATT